MKQRTMKSKAARTTGRRSLAAASVAQAGAMGPPHRYRASSSASRVVATAAVVLGLGAVPTLAFFGRPTGDFSVKADGGGGAQRGAEVSNAASSDSVNRDPVPLQCDPPPPGQPQPLQQQAGTHIDYAAYTGDPTPEAALEAYLRSYPGAPRDFRMTAHSPSEFRFENGKARFYVSLFDDGLWYVDYENMCPESSVKWRAGRW